METEITLKNNLISSRLTDTFVNTDRIKDRSIGSGEKDYGRKTEFQFVHSSHIISV
jgi:hypothetical protein